MQRLLDLVTIVEVFYKRKPFSNIQHQVIEYLLCIKQLSCTYPDYNSFPDILVCSQGNAQYLCYIVFPGSFEDTASYSCHHSTCNPCILRKNQNVIEDKFQFFKMKMFNCSLNKVTLLKIVFIQNFLGKGLYAILCISQPQN